MLVKIDKQDAIKRFPNLPLRNHHHTKDEEVANSSKIFADYVLTLPAKCYRGFQVTRTRIAFILILFSISDLTLAAQEISFKQYKDSANRITFDIPSYWAIKYHKEKQELRCIPTSKAQKEIFGDCFEGVVFRIEFSDYGLDTLLFQQFDKIDDRYVTSDRVSHDVPVNFISGKNWKGLRHDNICGISCNENGFQSAAGECQFFYFCRGNRTVHIYTNGRALDEVVVARLISSFQFID